MSDKPNKQFDYQDNELDHSIQEEGPWSFSRDSDIKKLQFQQQQGSHDDNFGEKEKTGHLMRESQLSQVGAFSYDNDYRLRQSMKSEQDFQLEDVGGNADMSDRNMQASAQVQQEVKIIATYQQEPQGNFEVQGNQESPAISDQVVKLGQGKGSADQHSQVTNEQPKLQQAETEQPKKQQSREEEKTQSPKKQQITSLPQEYSQKTQWSSQSNKSYLPMPEQDIGQSPNQQDSIKQEYLEPKMSSLKENFTLLTVGQPSPQSSTQNTKTSSIINWFKSSNVKPQTTSSVNQQTFQEQPSLTSTVQNKGQDAKQKYRKQMQAQMQGIQQSFAQQQKASKAAHMPSEKYKQKQKQKQKHKQKHKVNRTQLPQPSNRKLIGTQSQQMNSEQYRMLLRISQQKKKQNYRRLRQWDELRAQQINLHKNMIQLLQDQVDKRIKASLQNYQIYTTFFRQRLKQEEKFVTSPVINTKYALQSNQISKNIYINCSVILNSLSQDNQEKSKKIQDFVILIKNGILKNLTEHHLHQSQRQLLKVREKISTLKNSLKTYNTENQEKSQLLEKLFTESANNLSINQHNDFYSIQLQFLRSAGQQVLIQKRLGQNCLQYYHTALNQEFKRAKVIREALLTYSKGLKETYNMQLKEAQLEQLSKSEEVKLIQEFYSLEDMLDEGNINLLKTKFKIPDDQNISIKHVTKYVQSFQFYNYSSRMLLLKEFQAKYYSVGSSKDSKQHREQTCQMVITVDSFIHLFFSAEKSSMNFQPNVSFKIVAKQLQIRPQKQQFIDIVKKQQKRGSMISYFWDSKNQESYRLKLGSRDAKQEFCEYVTKLMF